MANGVINFVKRLVAPSAPSVGKSGIYIDDSGISPLPKLIDDDGTIYGFQSNYGQDFFYGQNLIPSTNTTSTPQAYATAVYSSLTPSALYEIEVGFSWNYSAGQRDFRSEINILGTGTVVGVFREFSLEPKDAGNDQRAWAFTKAILTGAELGASGNIILQYYAQQAGDTATLYDGIVKIKRVA